MVNVGDPVAVEPLAMVDGAVLDPGHHPLVWQSTPHLPHGWECGYFFDSTTRTSFCGDLLTQPGAGTPPLTSGDILGPSEAFRRETDCSTHSRDTLRLIEKLAQLKPELLACMHGSAWSGDGAGLLPRLVGPQPRNEAAGAGSSLRPAKRGTDSPSVPMAEAKRATPTAATANFWL